MEHCRKFYVDTSTSLIFHSCSCNQHCRREGGVLHVHGNTKDSEECQWADHVLKSISEIARSEGSSAFYFLIFKITYFGHFPLQILMSSL